jgi:hypothetical protein
MAKDDDAPWLAEADGPAPQRSLTVRILVGLAALAVVAIIIVFILLRPGGSSDQGYMEADQAPLITAESGPYKVKPQDPSGLDVQGQGDTMYAAGAGIEQSSDINFGAAAEEPLPRPGTNSPGTNSPGTAVPGTDGADTPAAPTAPPKNLLPPAMQQQAAKPALDTPKPAVVAPPKVAPKPALTANAPATQVQLGAFSTRARAETAWGRLVAKHGFAGLTPRYISTTSGDQTLFRLRTATPDAAALCARLAAGGDPCTEVKP